MLRIDDLRDKLALVTASTGIGAAVSHAFAQQGVRVQSLRFGRLLVAAAFTALAANPSLAANRIDLNPNWQFRIDPGQTGEASGWSAQPPAGTETVNVPHTWNIGTWHDYLGVAWYFRRFDMPPQFQGSHVELHFGATFYRARVWLNGIELGNHEGGFTAYSFDITRQLRRTNVLAVELDNRPGIATIPGFGARGKADAWYDWWDFGGIVRDVWLSASGSVWTRRQRIRTDQNAGGAAVHEQITLQSVLAHGTSLSVRATAYGPDDRREATAVQTLSVKPGTNEVALSLALASPRLWGVDRPSLYRMVVEILDQSGHVLDEHSDTFGVRTFEIRDRHLLLNGERVRLTGLARHEDSPWEGLAETRGTMWHDLNDMKALQTTLSRPVHYPQNPFILDYADRHGIVLIPEIPVWQFSEAQLSDPKVLALAQRQMQEMIEQAGNHPSIFAWSVANESATGTPGGIAYFRAMRELIRRIDPQRYVSFADDNLAKLERAEQSAANDADFLMMNQYYGTWHGPATALVPALDKINRLFPDKMVIVSEMGFPGIFAKNAAAADQARIVTMREQMPVLAARDWIAGAILWCYQDYKSRRNLWPGQDEGYVEHGLVDENRQRKPSYEVWKELTSPARIVAQWVRSSGESSAAFSVTVTPNAGSDLPSYPLHGYRLSWSLQDDKGKVIVAGQRELAEFADAVTVAGSVPPDAEAHVARLVATLLRPTGFVAAARTLEWTPLGGTAQMPPSPVGAAGH